MTIHEYFHNKRVSIIKKHINSYAEIDIGSGKLSKGELRIDILRELKPDIVADIRFLPIKSDSVRSIVSSHVIEHVENPDQALLEFKRIIKNKGKIFLFIPNDGSKLWNIVEKFWTIYYSKFIINKASPATHLSSFSPQSFFKLVDKVFSNILEFGSINGGMELYAVCTK